MRQFESEFLPPHVQIWGYGTSLEDVAIGRFVVHGAETVVYYHEFTADQQRAVFLRMADVPPRDIAGATGKSINATRLQLKKAQDEVSNRRLTTDF